MSMTLLAPDVLKNLFICIIVSLAEYQAGVAHVYTQSNHLSGNLDAEFEILSKRFVIFKEVAKLISSLQIIPKSCWAKWILVEM